jgi:iron complex outermembrane recepter protein
MGFNNSILKNALGSIFFILLLLTSRLGYTQTADIKRLKALSIEELMNIEVTAVTKSPVKLAEVASAVQIITREDIRRAGATSIPEALRLAPNLQVAQLNSSAWIISARGFNTVFANKLLVMIDGRAIYTPLFAGVLWDMQNVFLEDVDRIEIVSGPGGTVWGANAVNGVINIITKKASDSQGVFASVAIGDFMNRQVMARYGGNAGEKVFYRVYAQHVDRGVTLLQDETDNTDGWTSNQFGFRAGTSLNSKDFVTLQGDITLGERKTEPEPTGFDNQNVLARWTHTVSEKSEFILQAYYDRYWRDDLANLADELKTYDLDFQHRLPVAERHSLMWGAGYRHVEDQAINRTPSGGILPRWRTMPLISAFIQDEFAASEKIIVTIGSKFLHNFYSGFEYQPSMRATFSLGRRRTLWGAVSRAIRAPSRLDADYILRANETAPPFVIGGGFDFKSETLYAYELGYRMEAGKNTSLSFALFYNDYDDIYSVEPTPDVIFPLTIKNGSEAETWGGEFSGFWQVMPQWRLRGGFTYFAKDLRAKPGTSHDPSYLANDAKHRAIIQSMIDLPANLRFDLVLRYMDYLPATFATTVVTPQYLTFDTRIAWEYKKFVIALVGQNLASEKHAEFGSTRIPRSIYGKLVCRL